MEKFLGEDADVGLEGPILPGTRRGQPHWSYPVRREDALTRHWLVETCAAPLSKPQDLTKQAIALYDGITDVFVRK